MYDLEFSMHFETRDIYRHGGVSEKDLDCWFDV